MNKSIGRLLKNTVFTGALLASSFAYAGAVRPGFDSDTVPISSTDPYDNAVAGPVEIGFPINFYCNTYTNLYVNENGSITFTGAAGMYYELYQLEQPIIAPFYADADARPAGAVKYGTGTIDGHAAFGVTWDDVGYSSNHGDLSNRFQAILISRSDVATGAFELEFNYDRVQWETGDDYFSTGGFAGIAGDCAVAGFSDGFLTAVQLPGSRVSGSFVDTNLTSGLVYNSLNSSVAGRYRFGTTNFDCVTEGSPIALTSAGFTSNGDISFTISGTNNAGCNIYGYFGLGVDDLSSLSGGVNLSGGTGTFTDWAGWEAGGRLYRVKHGAYCIGVGYKTLNIVPGSTLIANQFDHPAGNTVASLLPSVPSGTTLRKWNESTQAFVTNTFTSSWSNTNMTLAPGEGAFIDNPTTNAFTIAFMGTTQDGVLSNPIPAGISLRSYKVPQWGTPDSILLDVNMVGGETLSKWNTDTQSFDVYTKDANSWTWSPESPLINAGEAFFIETTHAFDWDRDWSRCAPENDVR